MRFKVLAVKVFTLIVLLLSATTNSYAVGVGDVTLGVALDRLMDQVNQAIINARNAGNTLEMQAGVEAQIAIQNAQNAYEGSLNKTMDKVGKQVTATRDQLQSLVDQVTNNTVTSLDSFAVSSQQVINSLPFRTHQPQLTKQGPKFVVPSSLAPAAALEFKGNFEFSDQEDYEPTLEVNGNLYTPTENTTQSLKFNIPAATLFPNANPRNYSITTIKLSVPWRTSGFLGMFGKKKIANYKVAIGALPSSPGNLVIYHTTSQSVPQTNHVKTDNFHQCSTRECGNNDDINHPYEVTPTAGWTLVRGTCRFNVSSVQGETSYSFAGDDGNRCRYNVTTIHKSWGSSGSIDFDLSFDETQNKDVDTTSNEALHLAWGESKIFDFAPGSWRLDFTDFAGGPPAQFSGPNLTNKFVKITNEGGKVKIAAESPVNLVWP